MAETKESHNIYKIALLVTISCVLQISESLIPHPIPGLRLGLANVITLIALVTLGFRYALEITVLRTILSSFIMGSFMSPGFILSFSAGLISTLIMGLLFWLCRFFKRYLLSIIGISIIGALLHNIVQLYLAYLILIKHKGIFVFLPWLSIGAVIMGYVTGITAACVCQRLKEIEGQELTGEFMQRNYAQVIQNRYLAGDSLIHRLPSHIKISAIIIFSLAALIFNNFWVLAGLFLFLAVTTIISQTPLLFLFSKAKRYSSLIGASFIFPLFLNHGKHVISHIAYLNITSEGLNAGLLFACRIFFLLLASSLLARTTSPEELAKGLAKILSLLRPLGISGKRTAAILSLSWVSLPASWEGSKNFIRSIDLKKRNNLRNLIALFSDFIVTLYLQTEQVTSLLKKEAQGNSENKININS